MLFLLQLILCFNSISASNNNLKIHFAQKQIEIKKSDLLKRKDLVTVDLAKDPSLSDKPNSYLALEMKDLLSEFKISDKSSIYFKATDGMTVVIESQRIVGSKNRARAYLAIQPKNGDWHTLKSGQSAGPYFLIWKDVDHNEVGPEEWPYSLQEIEIKDSVELSYPLLLPNKNHNNFLNLQKGYQLFIKNCFACHKLNQKGVSDFGPDLNYPMSPVDYFKPSALKKYIRNPRTVRTWNQSRMPGFDEKEISNKELDQLITYLEWISKIKP